MDVFDPIEVGDRGPYDWVGTAIFFFLVSLPITFISKTVAQRMGLTIEHFLPLLEHPATRISLALIGGLIVWGNIREKKDRHIYVVSKRHYSASEIDDMVRQCVAAQTQARAAQSNSYHVSRNDMGIPISELPPEKLQRLLGWTPYEESAEYEGDDDDNYDDDDEHNDDDDPWNDEWDDDEGETASPTHNSPLGPIRLSLELVPRSCWFSNLRSALGQERWKIIAKAVSKNAKYQCELCGGKGPQWPVEAHETWEYDDARGVQRLSMIRALCPSCHEVKHFGLASVRGRKEHALQHLMKINQWGRIPAEEYVHHEFHVWKSRSEKSWTLDLSELSTFGFSADEIAQLQQLESARRN
jgi:hypothetical protein